VQVWRYDTILPGIMSQRMLHGSTERHWRLGWYHVLSRCLDHVFSVCILQWLTCKIIMNCFVGYHEINSPWFPKPSWLCYHRHIRLSDGLPPWSQSHHWLMVAWILRPGTRGYPGGAGRHRKSARIALLPLPSLLTHFDAAENRWELRKRNCKNLAGNHWFWWFWFLPFWLHIY